MAAPESDREEISAPPPEIEPALARAGQSWLAPLRERLAAMHEQRRLPHGILIYGQPGAGQTDIGLWLGGRLLCRNASTPFCKSCADCRLYFAGNHPDLHWVSVAADKKEISIDQLRTLSDVLTLRSYRGGAKVALIEPAEAMNIKSFNALLKTLEEPAEDTYLLLATSRSDRIPRTIASRCMRLRLPLPPAPDALDWLHHAGVNDEAEGLLRLANGAPFLAAEYAAEGLGGLDAEMTEALASASGGRLDVVGNARAWSEKAPGARLYWLESWLASGLKEAGLSGELVNNNRLPWLRDPGRDLKIRTGYRLLDELRDARRLQGGALNTQLVFERLLVSLAALLHGVPERRQESLE
jgi:DNA polymerase III subunit delta'